MHVRRPATIVQKKTGRAVQFEITDQSKSSVEAWLSIVRATGSRYLFKSTPCKPSYLPASMPGWCIAGSKASAWSLPFMARTRCGVRRPPPQDRQPPRRATPPRPHETGEHCSISWD
jgi:hypothetical protein